MKKKGITKPGSYRPTMSKNGGPASSAGSPYAGVRTAACVNTALATAVERRPVSAAVPPT
jgi:hypothetical protein